jgi:hypothetical protein
MSYDHPYPYDGGDVLVVRVDLPQKIKPVSFVDRKEKKTLGEFYIGRDHAGWNNCGSGSSTADGDVQTSRIYNAIKRENGDAKVSSICL